MKRAAKIWILIGVIFLLSGIGIMSFIYIREGSLNVPVPSAGSYEEKTYTAGGDAFTDIEFTDLNNDIVVQASSDDYIHITYYVSENYRYDISDKSGSLRFEYKRDKFLLENIFHFWSVEETKRTVVIALPESCSADISVSTVNGDIDAQGVSLVSLNASSVNGSLFLSGITAKDMVNVSATNGGITAVKVSCEDFFASTTNGGITLSDISSGEAWISDVNGSIKAENLTASDIECETTGGEITLLGIAPDSLKASTVNGSVTVEIGLSSSEYAIDASTVHGKISCDRGNDEASKQIELSSVNGDIDVKFKGQ